MSQPPVPPQASAPPTPPGPPYQVGQVVNGHVWTGSEWVPEAQAGGMSGQFGVPPGDPAVQNPAQNPKKPIFKRWWFWVAAAVVLLIIIVAISSGGGGQVAAPQEANPTTGAKKSQEPVAKNSQPAQPAGNAEIADQYGTFDTLTKSGKGDATIKLPAGAKAGMVTATHSGSSNFAVTALDENNESTGDLLVNTIGRYKGVTAFGLSSMSDGVKLKIDADGAWTMKISSLDKAPTLDIPVKQDGDKVYIFNGKAADWAIANHGAGNFVVTQYASVMPNLMVNEIGKYKGTVPANAGPSVVTIESDGTWTIAKG